MSFTHATEPVIGFATIGQTPRTDLVPYLIRKLSTRVTVIEGGVLDGLCAEEIAALDEGDLGKHMVTRLADGTSARLSFRHALPRMQNVVDALVQQGAELIVILCGADWSEVTAPVPVINLGKVFPATVESLAGQSKLAVMKPDAGQIDYTASELRERGIEAVVTSAFPYDDKRIDAARAAADYLKHKDVQLVWMSCVGMDEDMRQVVAAELGKPVILARSLLAGLIDNLLPASSSGYAM